MWTVTPELPKSHLSSDKTDPGPEGVARRTDREDVCKAPAQKRSSGNTTSTPACVSGKSGSYKLTCDEGGKLDPSPIDTEAKLAVHRYYCIPRGQDSHSM